jgi:hypothetical protein
MTYLIHPQDLVLKAWTRIKGFNEMVIGNNIESHTLLELATEVSEEWTNSWDDDQGFGSSDGTYMLKEFIDSVIGLVHWKNHKKEYSTKFNPMLEVVK